MSLASVVDGDWDDVTPNTDGSPKSTNGVLARWWWNDGLPRTKEYSLLYVDADMDVWILR